MLNRLSHHDAPVTILFKTEKQKFLPYHISQTFRSNIGKVNGHWVIMKKYLNTTKVKKKKRIQNFMYGIITTMIKTLKKSTILGHLGDSVS